LLARAREYARQYTERVNDLDNHYVRDAFEQFCLDTLAFPSEQSITTVANQREYTHSVVRVKRVIYDGVPLPILDNGATGGNYVVVHPNKIVLSFNPPAGRQIQVVGYGIPSNINSVVLEPAGQLMACVAMLAASKYLMLSNDPNIQSRAGTLLANYQAVVQQFRERYVDTVRVEDGSWSELGLLTRAREYARQYTERVNELDNHYVRDAFQQFCLDTLAFPTEQSITTTANQREYTHGVVRVKRVIYDNVPLPILDDGATTGNYVVVHPNRIVLSFNPPANKVIRVIGYGIPNNINSVVLEPVGQLMACVAMLAASKYLMLSNDPNIQSRAGTLLANYQAVVQQFRERYVDTVRVEDGSWSELGLLTRAREYARQYTERVNELDNHYVRDAFQQFCLDTLAFPSEQSITTTANQREYTHSVVRVKRVIYDGVPLPILDDGATTGNYVVVHPNRIVLSFNPPANKVIRVIGYGIPNNINSVVLEPVGQLMACVAMLAASKYLMLSNDPNTQSRATALLANYQAIVQQFRERYVDTVRVENGGWSELGLLTRAREYARRYTERVDGLDMHYVRGAFQQFCLDTNAFPSEHTINTIGNQREYTHPLVRVNRVLLDGDELILLSEPNEYYRACGVYPNRITLSFDPEPNQQLRIIGYIVPAIDTVYLEPAERLMSGIAMLSAYNYLIRFAEPQQIQSISLYQQEYRKIIDEFSARHLDGIRLRGGNPPVVGHISLI